MVDDKLMREFIMLQHGQMLVAIAKILRDYASMTTSRFEMAYDVQKYSSYRGRFEKAFNRLSQALTDFGVINDDEVIDRYAGPREKNVTEYYHEIYDFFFTNQGITNLNYSSEKYPVLNCVNLVCTVAMDALNEIDEYALKYARFYIAPEDAIIETILAAVTSIKASLAGGFLTKFNSLISGKYGDIISYSYPVEGYMPKLDEILNKLSTCASPQIRSSAIKNTIVNTIFTSDTVVNIKKNLDLITISHELDCMISGHYIESGVLNAHEKELLPKWNSITPVKKYYNNLIHDLIAAAKEYNIEASERLKDAIKAIGPVKLKSKSPEIEKINENVEWIRPETIVKEEKKIESIPAKSNTENSSNETSNNVTLGERIKRKIFARKIAIEEARMAGNYEPNKKAKSSSGISIKLPKIEGFNLLCIIYIVLPIIVCILFKSLKSVGALDSIYSFFNGLAHRVISYHKLFSWVDAWKHFIFDNNWPTIMRILAIIPYFIIRVILIVLELVWFVLKAFLVWIVALLLLILSITIPYLLPILIWIGIIVLCLRQLKRHAGGESSGVIVSMILSIILCIASIIIFLV